MVKFNQLVLFQSFSLACLPSAAMAQCVQPCQRLCRACSDSGSQWATYRRSGPQAPLDRQHGSLVVHEEPAALHISQPPEACVLTLPQHQVIPVHALQPLNQIQQGSAGEREGAARAEPALSAAVRWLKQGPTASDCSGPSFFFFFFFSFKQHSNDWSFELLPVFGGQKCLEVPHFCLKTRIMTWLNPWL